MYAEDFIDGLSTVEFDRLPKATSRSASIPRFGLVSGSRLGHAAQVRAALPKVLARRPECGAIAPQGLFVIALSVEPFDVVRKSSVRR